MYKLIFFVPESHVDIVKQSLFDIGAGKIGDYSSCAWQTLGEGQFLATPGCHPAVGAVGQVEKIAEYRVEMVCKVELIHKAVDALKASHPFEEPAYDIVQLVTL